MTTNNKNEAYLEAIFGPMFSGKTSYIVEVYKQCLFCSIPVIVINHSIDNRYDDNLLATHDKVMIPCVKTDKLLELSSELLTNKVILINEGQFFPDLYEFVINMLALNKQIYVCGLDGDYKRNKFGQILDIIPLCDRVVKLSSLCGICKDGTRGIFSKRISSELEQTVVGNDNYIPVCRKCYETQNNNISKIIY